MNAFIESANQLANQWSYSIWSILWQSTVLAGIVFILSLCLRRASAAVRFWLWMLVPLRLLVMPLITISLPLLPAITQPKQENLRIEPVSAEMIIDEPSATGTFAPPDESFRFEPTLRPVEMPEIATSHIRPNVWVFLLTTWLAGIFLYTVRLFLGWRKIKRITHDAIKVSDERVLSIANRASTVVGLKRVPEILVTSRNVSPFLFGVFRPVLVVPSDFIKNVS